MTRHGLSRAAVAVFALSIAGGAAWAQSAVSRLGVAEDNAHEIVMSAMGGGYGYFQAAAKPFLALGPAARAMAVNNLVAWAKAYVNSAAFKQEWAKKREDAKPQAPVAKGSVDDQSKQNTADMQKQIDQMKAVAASLPPEQRKAMEDAIKQIAAQTAAAAKDPAQQTLQRQGIEAQRAGEQKRYQDDLKQWQEDFPADPNVVIARRLKEFLGMSADVNFDAKLVGSGSGRTFADPQYEQKPDEWKICFRAGREATAAARAAAMAWLKEVAR